jgi:hypothetical protein
MKIFFFIVGSISLALGSLGVFLPVLPTTPFLLLSLYCYMRSSKKLYNFVLNHKILGPYVKDFTSGEGIPLATKRKAIALIWISIPTSAFIFVSSIYVRIAMFSIGTIVSIYIWKQETKEVTS